MPAKVSVDCPWFASTLSYRLAGQSELVVRLWKIQQHYHEPWAHRLKPNKIQKLGGLT